MTPFDLQPAPAPAGLLSWEQARERVDACFNNLHEAVKIKHATDVVIDAQRQALDVAIAEIDRQRELWAFGATPANIARRAALEQAAIAIRELRKQVGR